MVVPRGMVIWTLALLSAPAACFGEESPLGFTSSQDRLNACFEWAKAQAMTYAHESDPVGPWYEAALPGRARL